MRSRIRELGARALPLVHFETSPSKALAPLLALGSLVLFAAFVIEPTLYLDVERSVVSSAPKGAESNNEPAVKIRAIPFPVESDNGSQTEPSRRSIAMNIFLRSGYLVQACKRTEIVQGRAYPSEYGVSLRPEIKDCARLGLDELGIESDSDELKKASNLAIAVVAAEKFNRGSLHRQIEWLYARLYSMIFGHYPDLSLGPAQIRISRIQRAARNPLFPGANFRLPSEEAEIKDLLADECKSLSAASYLLLGSLSKPPQDTSSKAREACYPLGKVDCDLFEAASDYIGESRPTAAAISYAAITSKMGEMLGENKCEMPRDESVSEEYPEGRAAQPGDMNQSKLEDE